MITNNVKRCIFKITQTTKERSGQMLERHSYVVFGEDCNAPSVSHATHVDAYNEAKRLSEKYPGRNFYVAQVSTVVMHQQFKFVGIEKSTLSSFIGKEVYIDMTPGSVGVLIGLSIDGWPIVEIKQGAVLKVDHIFNRVEVKQPKVVKHPNVSQPEKTLAAAREELKKVLTNTRAGKPCQYILNRHSKDGSIIDRFDIGDPLPFGYIRSSIMRAFTQAKFDGKAYDKVYCYGQIWSRTELK